VRRAYLLAGALGIGLGSSALVRAAVLPTLLLCALAWVASPRAPVALLVCVVAVAGWWWGSERLRTLDRSALAARIGTAERALVETEEPARVGRFAVRVRALVVRWGDLHPHERALLELPVGRPPQGARLSVLGVLRAPRGPTHGFDERAWLRRHGVHAVLRADTWRVVGRRSGIGRLADRLHAWLERASAPGLTGERRAVLEGVVLGEDQGLSDTLRKRFRASGLYHLLAVSGGNVVVVGGGAVALALLLGVSRLAAEVGALLSICAYVLAVGLQPSVVRAGVAGALGSLAWLTGRQRDAWYALLIGAVALLAWNPYNVLDPGFQLSFAAVVSIFRLAPPLLRLLEGYPVPTRLAPVVAVSAACGLGTAPVAWLQFHALPLLTVPANAAAAPAVAPILGLALITAVVAPLAPPLAAALAELNGLCAGYLAACARLFGGLPGAQIRSSAAATALASGALLAAAYAWRRGERAEAGLPAHRFGPAEDRPRAAPTPRSGRR
jgi:ComEC/Rec2-related protein